MSTTRTLLQFVRPYLKQVALAILLTLIFVFLNNVSLWVTVDFIGELFPGNGAGTGSVTDAITGSAEEGGIYHRVKAAVKSVLIRDTQRETLQLVCLVILFTFFLKNIVDYLRRVLNRWIELQVTVSLRNRLQETIVHLPLRYFSESHSGKLTSIVFNDVKSISQVLSNSFGKLIMTPIQLLANILILIAISWKLSLIAFVIMPISGVIIFRIGQSMRRKSRRVLQQISEVTAVFQEALSSIQVVKAFTSEKREMGKFLRANRLFARKQMRAHRLSQASSPLNEVTAVSILIVLLWVGGNQVYSGGMEAEDFIRYLIFLFASLQPLREFSGLSNVIQSGLAAAERVFGIIETPRELYSKSGDRELSSFEDSIRLEDVSFRYQENGPEVLRGVNLEIRKGETVAFVGHSGSGKTTLINLIPRFFELESGRMVLDGTPTTDYTLTSLRSQIGIVTQETFLFNDTVRNNIAYGLDRVDEEQVIEAARVANAWEFIETMENGLDTMVGERGVNLSGGQKQRLSIARAVLKNPPILILDEATSALDTESEKLVQEAISAIMVNRTVLVIAHRLSTVIDADKIVVMSQGEVVDVGRHQELLDSCDIYRRLYEIQFKGESEENGPQAT